MFESVLLVATLEGSHVECLWYEFDTKYNINVRSHLFCCGGSGAANCLHVIMKNVHWFRFIAYIWLLHARHTIQLVTKSSHLLRGRHLLACGTSRRLHCYRDIESVSQRRFFRQCTSHIPTTHVSSLLNMRVMKFLSGAGACKPCTESAQFTAISLRGGVMSCEVHNNTLSADRTFFLCTRASLPVMCTMSSCTF